MGREIRKVPPNWLHPKDDRGEYIPLFDQDIDTAAECWMADLDTWRDGTHPDLINDPESKTRYTFWEWHGNPPDRETCRPKFSEEATWCQVYETVSEGTPVTPPFATKEELVNYLVEHGDFSDQRHGMGTWNREVAEQFVDREWPPSMIMVDNRLLTPEDEKFP